MKLEFTEAYGHNWNEHLSRPFNPHNQNWFERFSKPKFSMERPFRRQISPQLLRPRKMDCPSMFAQSPNFQRRIGAQVTDKKNVPAEKMSLPSHSSFQRAMGSILVAGQFFGLMPIYGILGTTHGTVHFKLLSLRTAYCFAILFCLIAVEAVCIEHMLLTLSSKTVGMLGGIRDATACAMFYGNALLATILFFRLAQKWPLVLSSWNNMEVILDRSRESPPPISVKFSLLTALILLLALGEHILSVVNSIPVFVEKYWTSSPVTPTVLPVLASSTIPPPSITTIVPTGTMIVPTISATTTPLIYRSVFDEFLTEYCQQSHACLFKWVEYNTGYGVAIFILSKISTFAWNFTDLFLVLVSTGISERFKQFNKALLRVNHKEVSAEEWGEYRTYFATLSAHSKHVDSYISGIVFASFGNNLYFICVQLLNGLNPSLTSLLDKMYYFYSFVFLLGRTVLVTLFAAQINHNSKQALYVLFNCPTKAYCTEAQRLQYQMTTDDIALSGMGFFSITRNFMLSVAAAIATYEIVLLQFNAVGHDDVIGNQSGNVSASITTES